MIASLSFVNWSGNMVATCSWDFNCLDAKVSGWRWVCGIKSGQAPKIHGILQNGLALLFDKNSHVAFVWNSKFNNTVNVWNLRDNFRWSWHKKFDYKLYFGNICDKSKTKICAQVSKCFEEKVAREQVLCKLIKRRLYWICRVESSKSSHILGGLWRAESSLFNWLF